MSLVIIIPVICTVITTLLAVGAWYVARKDKASSADTDKITGIVTSALQPLNDKLLILDQRTGPDAQERNRLQTLGMIREALDPIVNLQTTMGVKVDTLWTSLAASMAQILHQPDPARRAVDRLLESFMAGTLTNEERIELRKYLNAIKNWEPGSGPVTVEVSPGNTTTFPVHPGEQAPAAILLLTMDDAAPSPAHGGIFKS